MVTESKGDHGPVKGLHPDMYTEIDKTGIGILQTGNPNVYKPVSEKEKPHGRSDSFKY